MLTDTGNPLVRATEAAKAEAEDRSALHVERDFISEDEEERLVGEANRRLRTFPYQEGHFDDVIHGYRELLGFKHIAPESAAVLARAEAQTRHLCGDDPAFEFLPVHILDLHADGYILPHLDSYCGRTVAAVSLVSETVMRLTRPDRPDAVVELYLPRRSFYALRCGMAPHATALSPACSRPPWRGLAAHRGRAYPVARFGTPTAMKYAGGRWRGAAGPWSRAGDCP